MVEAAYVCARCRATTRLEATDHIACGQCGHGSLDVPRTPKPVRFVCK